MAHNNIIATPLTTTLSTYVANVFYGIFIQDDDDIAQTVYDRNYTSDFQETENGTTHSRTQAHDILFSTRAKVTNRQLVSQSFVVTADDDVGRTGRVAHTVRWSAVQDGRDVVGTAVSVLSIVWVAMPGKDEGRRGVEREGVVVSFV